MTTRAQLDVEVGLKSQEPPTEYGVSDDEADERRALLPSSVANFEDVKKGNKFEEDDLYAVGQKKASCWLYYAQLLGAFVIGVVCTSVTHLFLAPPHALSTYSPFPGHQVDPSLAGALAPPYVGSSEVHNYPPSEPTNRFPEYFPPDVGYEGPTPTGAEAGIVITAPTWPMQTNIPHLVVPELQNSEELGKKKKKKKKKKKGKKGKKNFDMLKLWGNLSPWTSIERGGFGVDSGPGTPDKCVVTGLHLLHRHGARYPTGSGRSGTPALLAEKLHKMAKHWDASGQLDFLNEWTYKLGEEILTPFGRQQMFDLGVAIRLKYGFLLKNFTESKTIPVFRTESQNRMVNSAVNFALGFFGWPLEDRYQVSIGIEAEGFNNSLAPSKACPNAETERGKQYAAKWADIYLKGARKRLQGQIKGIQLEIEDIRGMQFACVYETVALGYSKFCELFTEEEWEGFDYSLDLQYWYGSAFGSPYARALGIGWVQELVARLTHTPIAVHNSSTNSTLDDNPVTFPLNQSLYVDATHDLTIFNVITALNLTAFARSDPLSYKHIVKDRKFRSSQLAPFAGNLQFQLLECSSLSGPQIRIIINDGVVPLTDIKGCPKQKDGMCPVATFVEAMRELIRDVDWAWACHGNWTDSPGVWSTSAGDPPPRKHVN